MSKYIQITSPAAKVTKLKYREREEFPGHKKNGKKRITLASKYVLKLLSDRGVDWPENQIKILVCQVSCFLVINEWDVSSIQ